MGINANVTNEQITATVGETKIDVAVSGGFGPSGAAGSNGQAATVAVGTVTTGAPGSSAAVVNAGTTSAAVLNFTIPAGATGATGPAGPQGPAGAAGASSWNDITGKPSTFAPSAHAASHAVGGADVLTPADIGAAAASDLVYARAGNTGTPYITNIVPAIGNNYAGDASSFYNFIAGGVENSVDSNGANQSIIGCYIVAPNGADNTTFVNNLAIVGGGIDYNTGDPISGGGTLKFPDASVQTTAYTGKIGTVAGLVLKTGADGVIEALAQGTAGQVLKVNSGATGVEWGTAAADVSIDTTAADILSASSGSITADDAGSDKLVFWDDSAGKLTYLSAGTNITITDTTISAAGSTSASDLTSGTLAYARMADPTVTSPSQITASQNDYASFARGINRFTTNAARDITGMVAGSDGEVRVLTNVGTTAANTLTIKDESSSSTAANRFSVPWNSDCVIQAEGSVVVFYDGTSQRWRVIA